MFEYRKALLAAETPARVHAVIGKLYDLAVDGDVSAAKVYLDHICGKPPTALHVSGPDGGPLGGDVGALRAVILGALAPFPEARVSVSAALLRLREASADGPADGACN